MKIKKPKIKRPLLIHGNETEQEVMRSHYDPNGSYTGIPSSISGEIEPVQDADDL